MKHGNRRLRAPNFPMRKDHRRQDSAACQVLHLLRTLSEGIKILNSSRCDDCYTLDHGTHKLHMVVVRGDTYFMSGIQYMPKNSNLYIEQEPHIY